MTTPAAKDFIDSTIDEGESPFLETLHQRGSFATTTS
jgi:hypothetical protein